MKIKISDFSLLYLFINVFISLSFNIKYIIGEEGVCEGCVFNSNTFKCENSTNPSNINCPSDCRPNFIDDYCYNCYNVFNQPDSSKLYSIDATGCISPIDNYKTIIIETNECLGNNDMKCSYIFDNYCYHSYNETQNDLTILDDGKFECSGDKKISEDKIQDKDYIRCVERCPSGFYNLDDNKCVENCKNTDKIISNKTNNACTDSCVNLNKKLYQIGSKSYCVDKCPDSAPFYYDTIIPNKEIKCLEKCNGQDFYLSERKECIQSCDDYISLIDLEENTFICDESRNKTIYNESCPQSYPYRYQNSCLKKCSDTINITHFGINTYIIKNEGNSNKFCIEDCKNDDNKKFLDVSTLTCYQDCKKDLNKFYLGDKCIEECDKNHPYHISETGECVFQCSDGDNDEHKYYLSKEDNITCLSYCLKGESSYLFIDPENNFCLPKCEKPINPLVPKVGEGYILKNQTNITENESVDTYYCLKSSENQSPSSNNYYHKNDDNEFVSSCQKTDYKYQKYFVQEADNDYTCYKSCLNISSQYKYEYNYSCYDEEEESFIYNYYYIKSGIYKYLVNETDMDIVCPKAGFKYRRKNECVDKCYSNEYIILFEKDEDNKIKSGQCLDKCNDDYPFYSEEDKICYKTCPYKQINITIENTDETEGGNNEPIINISKSIEGNCLKECPSDHPYEGINGDVCYNECPKKFYYLTKDKKKKCVDDCDSISKYYFESDNECIDECKKEENNKTYYYYLDEDKKICLESCNSDKSEKKFSLKAENHHEPCLPECPDNYKFYYSSDKFCLSECINGYRINDTSNECTLSCGEGSFIIKENICSDKCTKDEPFYVPEQIGGISMYKCVSNCKIGGNNYNYSYEQHFNTTYVPTEQISEYTFYECVPSCPNNYLEYGYQCVLECPKGLFQENGKCLTKCTDGMVYEKNPDKDDYICKSSCSATNQFISSSKECVKYCPFGENFVDVQKNCKSSCDPLIDGEYYKKKDQQDNSFNLVYNIYECLKKCENVEDGFNYIIEGTKECIKKLDFDNNNYYLSEPENIYYSICLKNPNKPFSTNVKNCSTQCIGTDLNYGDDKICVKNCSNFKYNKIENEKDKSCVNKCDITSDYKYSIIDDEALTNEEAIVIKSCSNQCEKYYSLQDYICSSKCIKPNIFLISDKICNDKCLPGQFANPLTAHESNAEYECLSGCKIGLFYYENENICMTNCSQNYVIQGTQKCIESCDEIKSETSDELEKKYYFYEKWDSSSTFKENTCVTECPNDKQYIDYNNHCTEKCESEGYKYYNPNEKKCLNECPTGTKINDYECLSKCPFDKFEDKTGICITSCSDSKAGYLFYYESEKKCLKECNSTDYIYKNDDNSYKCVKTCPKKNDKEMYINDKECVENCPDYKKYFIGDETTTSKICMTDCPSSHPILKIDDNNDYKCFDSCNDYYITNKDSRITAKLCIPQCNEEYPFSFQKECFEICPNNYYYDNNNVCYEKCPTNAPYHEKNSKLCLENCPYNTADYLTKECMTNCEFNQFWINQISNGMTIKLCLSNCSQVDYTNYYTSEKECVITCDAEKFFVGDRNTGSCRCNGLFYYDINGEQICLDPTEIKSCENVEEYKIQLNGTNQCLKTCSGVLSVNEDICYSGSAQTIQCPNNTKVGFFDGKIKCDCKYNYYYNSKNLKICLGENEKCPNERYFIPETKECVIKCNETSYPYLFDNNCFKTCPSGTIKNNELYTCNCEYNWYKISDSKFVCLDENEECNDEYPYLIVDKKECVKNCGNTEYPVINNNKCYSSCNNGLVLREINGNKMCLCKYNWYYDTKTKQNICNETNSDKNCEEINSELKFLIKETKECVNSCPNDYKYYFNNECFSSCEKENLKSKTNSYECQCNDNWRIINETYIECTSECKEDEFLVYNTGQCIKDTTKCPYDNPYLFNKICYKECIGEYEPDKLKGNECKCKYLWYENSEGSKICMKAEEKECPSNSLPYLIYQTNECVKDISKCEGKKIFNNICYDKCPLNTKENGDNCECDPNKGFWYKYLDSNNNQKFNCSLSICPSDKPKYHIDKKECASNCGEINAYDYLDICYDSCPSLTKQVNNDYSCQLSTEFEEKNLTELVKNIRTEIKEIYESLPTGGLVINNNDNNATMQIYGLNRKNKNNTDSIIRTNLAYIDLSGCIDKIYENNKMKDKDDIVVVKLDLKSKNKKLVINPIEYEFVNSRTGEVLDASVCEKNEVVISYPITYMLKYKKKLRNLQLEDDELQEIVEKFNRGKELNDKDNLIDSFNYNSTIYSDICYPIEINGKDLVLDNRISYFYPNYSFCESLCTYDYTDFSGERIYCNCSIKSGLEIDRTQSAKLAEYNKNETDNNQIGPTNIPVLKCISKAKISGNGGFYFCIIFIAVEIGFLFIIIFQGIYSLNDRIRSKMFGEEDKNINNNEEDEKINKINKNKYTTTNTNSKNIKTSERDLDMPPKRKNNNSENNDSENNKEVINIKKSKHKSKAKEINRIIDEKNNYDIFSDQQNNNKNFENIEFNKYLQKHGIETQMGFFHSVKKEEKLLRKKYSISIIKDKFDSIIVVLTSIFDKIYLIRTLLLSGKYEIVSVMFSLYLLCHMLLLTFSGFFFDIKTIRRIWEEENYPNINYYLLYGFISNLIVWIIFKLFYSLLENDGKVRKILNGKKIINIEKKERKFNKLINEIKRNIIIYLSLQFALLMFCSFYLITFCGIYSGLKIKIFQAYGIAFIEIVIIKIIYGAILGILRKISLYLENKKLYNIVLIFNKYIS